MSGKKMKPAMYDTTSNNTSMKQHLKKNNRWRQRHSSGTNVIGGEMPAKF